MRLEDKGTGHKHPGSIRGNYEKMSFSTTGDYLCKGERGRRQKGKGEKTKEGKGGLKKGRWEGDGEKDKEEEE